MNSIGIIGGGITGLTTAYRLKQGGAKVTVYEASPRVGGPIQSIRKDGFLVEFGPNTMLENSDAITSLIHDLGIENHQVFADVQSQKRFIVRNGKPVALSSSPPAFFTTSLFSLSAKLRLIREPFIGKAVEEESVADFTGRRLGTEFLDYAIDPFVAGVYAGEPEKLSIQHAFPKLYALEEKYGSLIKGQIQGLKEKKKRGENGKARGKMFSFDEGLQVLIDKLFHNLETEIRLRTAVTKIERLSGGWNVFYNDNGTDYINTHSQIILTLPAYKIAAIENNVADFTPFKEIYYPPVASLALGFRKNDVTHPLDGFGMLIPKKEHFHILGTLFSSSLFPRRAPNDDILLTTYIGGARQPELAKLSENELKEIVVKDLRKLLGIKGDPIFTHHAYFEKAIPQYNIGYGIYKELMDEIEYNAPGVFFAGNFRNGISLSDCISSASVLAEKILA